MSTIPVLSISSDSDDQTGRPVDGKPAEPVGPGDVGIFDLTRVQPAPAGWAWAIPPVCMALLGSMAFVGQFRPSEVSRLIELVLPLNVAVNGCLLGAAVFLVAAVVRGQRSLAVLSAGVLGYLAGHLLFSALPIHGSAGLVIPFESNRDVLPFVRIRFWYGICVGGTALLAILAAGKAMASPCKLHLGIGNWNSRTRDFTHRSKPESYWRAMLGFAVFAGVLWCVGQASVELKPLRSGTLWQLIPAILIAASVNALVEEYLFRGVMQPAIVGAAGMARGLWLQGLFFGLLHWGASVGALAALPVSLLIGVGAVFWGKAVIETRGLSWVIIAHAMVDVAIMSAYFVPH